MQAELTAGAHQVTWEKNKQRDCADRNNADPVYVLWTLRRFKDDQYPTCIEFVKSQVKE